MLLGECSSSCLHSGAVAETISVACSEHNNWHEAFDLPYLLEYNLHFFVPEIQSKNGGVTYTQG